VECYYSVTIAAKGYAAELVYGPMYSIFTCKYLRIS